MSRAQLGMPALVAMVASGALVVLAIGWFAVVAPQRHRAESAAKAVETAQTKILAVQQADRASSATAGQKQPAIRTADLYRIVKAMPSSEDQPDLLLQLDQVARAAGVTVLTITPHGGTVVGAYTTLPIDLTVTGDYYAITDMLYRLRALVAVRHGALDSTGRLFAVESLSLSPAGTGKELSATLTVDAFVWGAVPGATAATTPAATQSTTTSSTSTSTTSTTSTTGTTTGSGG